jgi:pyridoxal 5'-phosphate synthase pdxT subunit
MKVGVLALQGDVREHQRALEQARATPVVVKHSDELDDIDALIVPGGESTTIGKLLDRFGLLNPISEKARSGMPLFGTCAGAILMAREIVGRDEAPHRMDLLDVSIRRNAYGRQVDSFESDLSVVGLDRPLRAVFIRAPIIENVGAGVDVLATFEDRPVLVREGSLWASTFHPEMTDDHRVHELFVHALED